MNVRNPRLVISAANHRQWPTTTMPEIVLCGRSNVGKSSFVNTLVGRKNLAYVGKNPGKTRLLNFYNLDDKLMLVDAPGYGYQKAGKSLYYDFGRMMENYFQKRNNLRMCIIILDIRHYPSKDDLHMIDFVRKRELDHLIITTKCDKISYFQQLVRRQKIAEQLGLAPEELILFTKDSEKSRDATWERIDNVLLEEPV